MRLPEKFEVKIENLVFGGEGLGYFNNRPIFVFGTLPGEKVLVRPVKVRRRFTKAELLEVLEPSPDRIKPKSEHSPTCSPWQIMPYDLQLKYKEETTNSMWKNFTGEDFPATQTITLSPLEFGYRNKLEFSFNKDNSDKLTLAFHRRYHYNQYFNLDKCFLGANSINEVASLAITLLNDNKIELEALKNLTLRYSFNEDKVLATLFVTNKSFPKLSLKHPNLKNWRIIYSDPQSPITIETETILDEGENILIEQILDTKLAYTFSNFFQVNPSAFEKLIEFTKKHIKSGDKLVDLYSGVGTIGILLGNVSKELVFVEKDETAKKLTEQNLVENKISGAQILSGASEKQDLPEILKNTDVLTIDPPRAGMHPKVLKRIIEAAPKQIIYISCNPSTQARDIKILQEHYKITAGGLFDLYPQTPHVESVVILEKA